MIAVKTGASPSVRVSYGILLAALIAGLCVGALVIAPQLGSAAQAGVVVCQHKLHALLPGFDGKGEAEVEAAKMTEAEKTEEVVIPATATAKADKANQVEEEKRKRKETKVKRGAAAAKKAAEAMNEMEEKAREDERERKEKEAEAKRKAEVVFANIRAAADKKKADEEARKKKEAEEAEKKRKAGDMQKKAEGQKIAQKMEEDERKKEEEAEEAHKKAKAAQKGADTAETKTSSGVEVVAAPENKDKEQPGGGASKAEMLSLLSASQKENDAALSAKLNSDNRIHLGATASADEAVGVALDKFLGSSAAWVAEFGASGRLALRKIIDAPTVKFREDLHKWQFGCAGKNRYIERIEYTRYIGSMTIQLKNKLINACQFDAVFVPLVDGWIFVDAQFCPEKTITCYFLPMHNCLEPSATDKTYVDTWPVNVTATNTHAPYFGMGVACAGAGFFFAPKKQWINAGCMGENGGDGFQKDIRKVVTNPRDHFGALGGRGGKWEISKPTTIRKDEPGITSITNEEAYWRKTQLGEWIHRYSYRIRSVLSNKLQMYLKGRKPFGRGTSTPCAALHVRKGDKMQEMLDGRELIFNHSLTEFVDMAQKLAADTGRGKFSTFYLLTDDQDAIDATKTMPDLTFHYVEMFRKSSSKLLTGAQHAQQVSKKNATESALEVFQDFELGSQCDALVLNMKSFFSGVLLERACFKWGTCPTFYNFGNKDGFYD